MKEKKKIIITGSCGYGIRIKPSYHAPIIINDFAPKRDKKGKRKKDWQ